MGVVILNNYFAFILAVDFFNQINMLYGTITEFCTEINCPIMSAGPKYDEISDSVIWSINITGKFTVSLMFLQV